VCGGGGGVASQHLLDICWWIMWMRRGASTTSVHGSIQWCGGGVGMRRDELHSRSNGGGIAPNLAFIPTLRLTLPSSPDDSFAFFERKSSVIRYGRIPTLPLTLTLTLTLSASVTVTLIITHMHEL
jgi:hypothetical protein